MPRERPVLFIDDGGVMNDNERRAPQWAALLGPYMSERYGGEPAEWSRVNGAAFTQAWKNVVARIDEFHSHADFHREYSVLWCQGMFSALGLPAPSPGECVHLVNESSIFVLSQVRSDMPGAAEAVHQLAAAGFELHTASGTISRQLDVTLTGMGIRECFGPRLYGPDLIDLPKHGAEYYIRIFNDAGVHPGQALVVDDSESACQAAREAGARSLRVGADAAATSLSELSKTILAS